MNWGKKEKRIDILDLSTRQVTQTIGKSLFNFYDTKVNSPFTVCEFSLPSYSQEPLRTVPTNSKVFLRGLLNMRGKHILIIGIEIQKENWG